MSLPSSVSFPIFTSPLGGRYGTARHSPEQLVEVAAERGLTTLGLTDRDGVRGAVRFARAALAAGVSTIFGTELALHGQLSSASTVDAVTHPGAWWSQHRSASAAGHRSGPRADRVGCPLSSGVCGTRSR